MQKNLNSTNLISLSQVSKIHPDNSVGVKDINFDIQRGEFICIIGASGSGKSTLLKLIAGLETPTIGRLIKPENVAMVFQSGALLPWLTVLENVSIVLAHHKLTKSQIRETSLKYIKMMGLQDYVDKYPRMLSGGQRQRVGIARALVVDTELLLLDEPFSALDAQTTAELHNDILKIWQKTNKTIVMVSHLIEEAATLADRIILLKNHTLAYIFNLSLPRPRQEQGEKFMSEVNKIKKKLFY
ncbi:MAG TPA: ABC transporter ATP-binding protein [Patescibacteria group bacterium]